MSEIFPIVSKDQIKLESFKAIFGYGLSPKLTELEPQTDLLLKKFHQVQSEQIFMQNVRIETQNCMIISLLKGTSVEEVEALFQPPRDTQPPLRVIFPEPRVTVVDVPVIQENYIEDNQAEFF